MSKFTRASHPGSEGSRIAEAVMEVGMIAAAAGLTATIWLSVGAWSVVPAATAAAATQQAAQATVAQPVQRITLPTVIIVGRRELLGTPVATTAQNTAAIPVTLPQ